MARRMVDATGRRRRLQFERRDGAYVWVGGPAAPGASATTLGPLVLVRRDRADDEHLMRHELEHVHQYDRYGFVGFFRWYLAAYLRGRVLRYPHWAAYRRIPFEVEAEWRARRSWVAGGGDIPAVNP